MRILFFGSKRHQESASLLAYNSGWLLTSMIDSAEVPVNAINEGFSAILVVIGHEQSAGLQTIRSLARAGVTLPIVAMQVNDNSKCRAEALLSGAVISLPCTIDPYGLQIHLQALVRLNQGRSTNSITIAGIRLDPFARHIQGGGEPISLAGQQFELLELLFSNKGRVLSRNFIMEYLYGGKDEPTVKIIDVQICKIRNALKTLVGDQEVIRTIWGVGYVVDDWKIQANAGLFASMRAA